MRISLLSNEYPPHIYGGAGVHAEHLSRELAQLDGGSHIINIFCFGEQREHHANKTVTGIHLNSDFPYSNLHHRKLIDTLLRNILMVGSVLEADIIHCHTWYTYLAGCLIKQISNIPLVITAHSLEPQRPWKLEQLGSAYKASCWLEKTAFENADGIIAVSNALRTSINELCGVPLDKIRTIPNGIDVTFYKPTCNPDILASYGISPAKPFLLFVGRITRQKGIFHLLDAVKYLATKIQIVLIATDPDTIEIREELSQKIKEIRSKNRHEIIWINTFIPEDHLVVMYSHASVFVCPSIYEPFGIINLEAMACETPIVASATGGILETVTHGQTGLLVPFEPKGVNNPEPRNPDKFHRNIASAVNSLLASSSLSRDIGAKAREKVSKSYSWKSIAGQTLDFYRELLDQKIKRGNLSN
jgi:starch synthase